MPTYLLDANILIALATPNHPGRNRSRYWAKEVTSFAVCPITEGALVRNFLFSGRTLAEAQATLTALAHQPGYQFWPDDISYSDTNLGDVHGHKQATDAYLVALTRAHPNAKLATMDAALAAAYPDVVELIP